MGPTIKSFRPLRLAAVASLVAILALAPSARALGSLVISQVYGGGGNSGATLKNDFIELFNPTNAPISVNGWSVQYGGATTSTWTVTPLTNFSIGAGKYYLIQQAAGAGGTANLPTPDAIGTTNMSATAGKVALVSNTIALSGCPISGSGAPVSPVIDFIGYGNGTGANLANCFEGLSGPAATLTNTTSTSRKSNGCTDTDDNAADFIAGTVSPRNTSSPTTTCGTTTNPSGVGASSPNVVRPGNGSRLTVQVTPGSFPTSTGITVQADLSSIGGSMTQTL
jgi:predicted extracellular nuclease